MAVNARGWVTGSDTWGWHAIVWTGADTPIRLTPDDVISRSVDLNDRGDVLGERQLAGEPTQIVVWRVRPGSPGRN